MRSIVILLTGFFSTFLIDLNRYQARIHRSKNQDSISLELNEKKEKLKRKLRKYKNRKYSIKSTYRLKHFSLKGTHAKDKRYSNQKMLRRMYRGC